MSTVSPPAATIPVDDGAVHIWSASLDAPPGQVQALARLLSPTETVRASRLRMDRDRDRFIVRRGLLRVILGRYVGCHPGELEYQYGEYGKPELPGWLRFNLSSSRGLALYALARDRELGVDVERMRDDLRHADLADRYFSTAEREELRTLPAGVAMRAFFNGWTRKEAYVKALGTGLVTRLDSFTVSLTPGAPARLLAPHVSDGRRWTLLSLDVMPGHAAALAVAGGCGRVLQRHWPGPTGAARARRAAA